MKGRRVAWADSSAIARRNSRKLSNADGSLTTSLNSWYVYSVAQIFNLLYRRIVSCRALATSVALEIVNALPIANRRYSVAQRNRNQSQLGRDAFHRVRIECVGSVALDAVERVPTSRTRAEFARLASILGDTDRLQSCATQAHRRQRRFLLHDEGSDNNLFHTFSAGNLIDLRLQFGF